MPTIAPKRVVPAKSTHISGFRESLENHQKKSTSENYCILLAAYKWQIDGLDPQAGYVILGPKSRLRRCCGIRLSRWTRSIALST
jgi:hypothetical protein